MNNNTNNNSIRFPIWLWISLFLFLVIWFYMLGARTLVPTDEGRYAEMAREMVATGDWITPRLNAIKYFEKPPLQTWMNALTFSAFGLGEWQARLWTGLSALFGIFLVGYTGTRIANKPVGITAAAVLGSSFWWAGLGHVNSLDMGLSGMMTLALCGLLLAQRDQATKTEQRNGMLLCWLGMALATMSKGPMGIILPGAVLFLYTFAARDWRIWQRLHLVKGLLLFFAITTPWFVLVSRDNPEFLHFFFIHEHWERFTSKVHHRDGPLYYFIPLLIVGIFPWLGLLVQSMWNGTKQQAATFQAGKLLLIWALFIFFFFSISSSKLPSYILPIFPALALLIAMHLERPAYRGIVITSAMLSLFGLIGLGFWLFFGQIPSLNKNTYDLPLYIAYLPYIAIASGLMLIGGIKAWYLARTKQQVAIWVLAWAGFLSGQILMMGHEPWGRYIAGTEHLAAIQAELKPETSIYAVGRYEQSLPFYLRHTTILVEHPDEMEFGLQYEPQLWIPKREDFVKQWLDHQANGVAALAIIRPDIYDAFVQQGIPMRVIAQDPRRVIVSSKLN
ncbi:glycosyltransferase family 39 protein [Solimicrobium silvestre]|uniref:4-amino-4-deoxy-L-arabinose transferase and related glycosyltransferases of PMT family n=1 Tax=Solimicrobium silvestre TaxID=2099400 RepID=A0A2S9GX14_9BURK|nr:glycosyltransferase family 39 protein [Solimicrobium silvestre]PRC92263.1 4-amino-4-deoxy-L-arabinose transferase and related glycosyltransferases of PMT family [Solimicrobium silvestre]